MFAKPSTISATVFLQADACMWSLYAIQSRGVRHGDFTRHNIILQIGERDPAAISAVVLDFSFANSTINENGRSVAHIDANGYSTLLASSVRTNTQDRTGY